MGATKKRRRSKHRGNAAGMIEARGRTSSGGGRTAPAGGARAQGPRVPQPPTWRSAALKALVALAILIVGLTVLSKNRSPLEILPIAVFGYVMYVPIAYFTDKWVYDRYVKRTRSGR